MGVITFTTLNRELKKALKDRQLSVEELDQVYQDMKNSVEEGRKEKITPIVAIVFCVFLCIVYVNMALEDGAPAAEMIPVILVLVVFCAAMVFVMKWLNYGLMAQQFQAALKKGYPEYADKYKL